MEKQPTSVSTCKYKFLRRAINVNDNRPDTDKVLAYSKVKRVYFKKIKDIYCNKKKIPYFLKSKQLNCLSGFEIILLGRSDTLSLVKHAKNLKSVKFLISFGSSLAYPVRILKSIPKRIERIEITGHKVKATVRDLQGFYRGIGICRQLRVCKMELFWQFVLEIENGIENHFIHRYVHRLKNLKEFRSLERDDETYGLTKLMKKDQIWSFITHRSIILTGDMEEADSLREESNEEEERLPPILRFQHFPSLKSLKIGIPGDRVSLVPSLVQEFKHLTHLEHLTLRHLRVPSRGGKFLLEGLLHLPLLKSFRLESVDINHQNQQLFIEFLRKQTQLIYLSLNIAGAILSELQYEEYDRFLEIICQSLHNKNRLEYLSLKAARWSLQSLSKGFGQMKTITQLRELEIEVFDHIGVISPTPGSKVKGLCDFIRKQKLSLQKLLIKIEFVKEDEIVDALTRTIAELDKLKSLTMGINTKNRPDQLAKYALLSHIPKESLAGLPLFKETFAYISQTLQKLNQLCRLELILYPIVNSGKAPDINSSVVFYALPVLKNLQTLTLELPYLERSIKSHPKQLQLLSHNKSLADISITCYNEEIEKFLNQTKYLRYLKSNLTF